MGVSVRGSILAVGVLLGVGCSNSETFNCQDDAGCGTNGQCEANGFCSFPDAECESGRRYGDLAGAGLQGQCVAENESSTGALGSSEGSSGMPSLTSGASTGGDESSTGVATTGHAESSTGGQTCDLVSIDVAAVPADIVVLVGPGIDADSVMPVLGGLTSIPDNNLALIVPDDFVTDSLAPDCPAGCADADCPSDPTRVLFTYDGEQSPYDSLSEFSQFECIFRAASPGSSEPVSNLLFITDNPQEMPPRDLASLVLSGARPLRVHVSCPGCDQDLFTANALLKEVVVASGGTVSDSNMPASATAQAERIGAARKSCIWPDSGSEVVVFQPEGDDDLISTRIASVDDCDSETIVDSGMGQFYGADDGVSLCLETCRWMQSYPAATVDIAECG